MLRLLRVVLVVLVVTASNATAGPTVQLSIADGRVWLVSDGATAGQILAEWARVGGTRIVNADRVAGGLLTLDMRGVPELEAIDILLRSTAGFIAAARTPGAAAWPPNLSRFDRIVVLPAAAQPPDRSMRAETAYPPARSPRTFTPPVPIFNSSGAQRIIGPDGQPVPDDQDDAPSPSLPSSPSTAPGAPASPNAVPVVPAGVAVPGLIPPARPSRPGPPGPRG
jgi:hypothetical protein